MRAAAETTYRDRDSETRVSFACLAWDMGISLGSEMPVARSEINGAPRGWLVPVRTSAGSATQRVERGAVGGDIVDSEKSHAFKAGLHCGVD